MDDDNSILSGEDDGNDMAAASAKETEEPAPKRTRTQHRLKKIDNSKPELFSVEFPGIVKNVDKALVLLGGAQRLSELTSDQMSDRKDDSKLLDMTFRPTNPFAHPIQGRHLGIENLLVKVSRQSPTEPYQMTVEGIITSTWRFRGMADFQFVLPPTDPYMRVADILRPVSSNLNEKERLQHFGRAIGETSQLHIFETPELVATKQVLFSPVISDLDTPIFYGFRANTSTSAAPFATAIHQTQQSIPKPRSHCVFFIEFSKESDNPLDVCVTLTANISDHIKQRVKELFQLKPIWSRVALENNVDEQARPHIRDLLPLFAYMFSKGPWRGIWTRFGYDPRRDQASRMYQICAIRVEDKRQKKRQQPEKDTNSFDETPRTWSPRSHILDENTTEAEYQKYYQLCDLLQPEFLTVIEDTTKFKSSCDAKSGWYTPEALLDLRVLVKQRQLQGPKFSIENISARRETRRGKPFTKSLIEKKKTLAQKRKRTEPSIPSPTTTAELELQPQQETANTSTNAVSNDDSHGGSSSSTTSNVVVFKENPVHEQRILPDASAYQLLSQEDIDEFDIIDEDEDDEAD